MRIPRLRPMQMVIEAFCLILALGGLIFTIIKYPTLPAEIPGHFNAAGEITDYTSKSTVWFLEGMSFFGIYVFLTVLECIPAVTRNPSVPWRTDERARGLLSAYTITLLGEIKLICLAMLSYMLYSMTSLQSLEVWVIFLCIGLMTADIVIRLIQMAGKTRAKYPF